MVALCVLSTTVHSQAAAAPASGAVSVDEAEAAGFARQRGISPAEARPDSPAGLPARRDRSTIKADEGGDMAHARKPGPRFGEEERLRSAPATPDRGHTERFTDDEAAALRQLRFGQLPEAIAPSDWVESVDADSPFEPPEPRLGAPYLA